MFFQPKFVILIYSIEFTVHNAVILFQVGFYDFTKFTSEFFFDMSLCVLVDIVG